jgi:hypothetical protein
MPLRVVLLFLLVAETSADALVNLIVVLIGSAVFKESDDTTEGDLCTNVLATTGKEMWPYLKDPGACWTVMLINVTVLVIANGICMIWHKGLTGFCCDGCPLCESEQRVHRGIKSCACFWIFGAWTCCCMIDCVESVENRQARAVIVGNPVSIGGQTKGC